MKLQKLASNFSCLVVNDDKEFYFSYETIIGFKIGRLQVKSKNIWSQTTGKHLNQLVDFEPVDHELFKGLVENIDCGIDGLYSV